MLKDAIHTTNYCDTLIEIADDCPVRSGQMPPQKGESKSVATLQFEMVYEHPYKYTSDEVLFGVFALRREFTEGEMDEQRAHYFSKGQACFRASPLTKQYGWGVHSNSEGKIALYGAETEEYQKLLRDNSVKKVKAMRSKRA